jgi:thioredoxin 1
MLTSLIIVGLITAVLGIIVFMAKAKMKNLPLEADHEKILTLTDQNFHHQTKDKIVLIDFWAGWCAPCRLMAPVLNQVSSELTNNLHVGKVDIEQYQSLAQKFKIRSIPTMVLLKDGIEINRFVGVKSKSFLLDMIKSA